jgi:hypothetical protein
MIRRLTEVNDGEAGSSGVEPDDPVRNRGNPDEGVGSSGIGSDDPTVDRSRVTDDPVKGWMIRVLPEIKA